MAAAISAYTWATVNPCSIAFCLSTVIRSSGVASPIPLSTSAIPSTCPNAAAISPAVDCSRSRSSPYRLTLTPEPLMAVIMVLMSEEPDTVTSPSRSEQASAIRRDSSLTETDTSSRSRIYMLTLVTSSLPVPIPSMLLVPLESIAPTVSTSSMALTRSMISSDTWAVCSRVASSAVHAWHEGKSAA